MRLAGGHQVKKTLPGENAGEKGIISEVTKVCGRVEMGHGWEKVLGVS